MSHILVKWVEDEKWDVYPVSALADADVAFRLISQQGCTKQLRGTIHRVSWKEGAPPALAELLAFEEELRGRTLLGGKSNLHADQPLKEALDPVRVQAVIDYSCSKFPSASISYIKNSLSSMLARELK
ncbi:hypothetical protein HPB50_024301 [Hyalomma asiaticum]|uniref:Uncharacterized protein n=1 Tax=Hyalomma asiaticum TaxID=266040 RepID=A0ACB7RSJ3_HYAAI|nr:hypothetical protein HPB50_024301 [Hyalomma asiaticum]